MQSNEQVGLQTLDQRQHFEEIQIESDKETIKLSRVSLGEAMDRVQEVISQKTASSFYKNITVHLGAKTRQKVNYLQEHYSHRLQVMKLALQEEKEHLRKIIEAKDENELKMIQTEHELNQEYIKGKQNYVKHEEFIPCIYIQAEKKRPLFGLITQEFSRHGMGNFVAKLGYRSPFLNYDKLEFNFQWPISSLRRKYYQIGAEWSNPISDGSTSSLRLNSVREPTYKNIDSQIVSVGWGILKGDNKYEIQYGHRNPFVHSNIEQNINNQFYQSSSKFALKYSHFFENSIRFEEVAVGKYSEFKSQLALPVLGEAKFMKLEYNFRKFFDTYKARNWFNSEFIQKLLWKSTVESNFSISAIAEYGKNHFLNDILESIEVRGFEAYRKPMPSYLNIKGSLKFNIHNYPLLKDAGIVTFLYSQMGLSFLKSQPLRPYALSSCGLGLSFYAGPFTQIEVLCNLAQWQSKPLRQPANFQIRFGVFD